MSSETFKRIAIRHDATVIELSQY